jgi:4-diphosphocytidyl-2-C-methyl-D-erythritol kinase
MIGVSAAVELHIRKIIPVSAGLGGGSSDAASVLLGLNQFFGGCMAKKKLTQLGESIGKDVPFFLSGEHCAHVSGAGEVITPLPTMPPLHYLIINPGVAVSTGEAFDELDQRLWYMTSPARHDRSRAMVKAVGSRDVQRIAASLHNDFEATIERRHPIVGELKQALVAFGAVGALMSGSGPTVFGLFDSRQRLAKAEEALHAHYRELLIGRA